jgi:hypothetical protein
MTSNLAQIAGGFRGSGMRKRKTFDATLDEVEAPIPAAGPTGDRAPAAGVSTPIPPLEEEAHADGGGAYLWDQAVAWVPEPEIPEPAPPEPPPPPPPPRPPPSAHIDDVARELGLGEASTPLELARIRRRFMWENHPDRYPEQAKPLANRRVAIANMLIDRALGKLARAKRPR